MKHKALVILSSGIDSTVNLYMAHREYDVLATLTFDYGQKSAPKELECAKKLSDQLGIKNIVIPLPWLKNLGQSSLTSENKNIPLGSQVSIESKSISDQTAKSVWVPNRNGVFLNIAASFAESLGCHYVIPGFNAEEASTFPDNSYEFLRALRKSFSYSTKSLVDIQCFTINMTKSDLVKMGQDLLVPFEQTWPCYQNLDQWCGECESCLRAKRAFRQGRVDIMGKFLK